MTLEETINFIKKGSYSELEDIDLVGIVYYLEELKVTRKALELMAEELALNKHCVHHPYCYIEEDEEDCQLIEECHSSKWLFDYYLEKAREEE